jgi:hypothetical protein
MALAQLPGASAGRQMILGLLVGWRRRASDARRLARAAAAAAAPQSAFRAGAYCHTGVLFGPLGRCRGHHFEGGRGCRGGRPGGLFPAPRTTSSAGSSTLPAQHHCSTSPVPVGDANALTSHPPSPSARDAPSDAAPAELGQARVTLHVHTRGRDPPAARFDPDPDSPSGPLPHGGLPPRRSLDGCDAIGRPAPQSRASWARLTQHENEPDSKFARFLGSAGQHAQDAQVEVDPGLREGAGGAAEEASRGGWPGAL